MKYAVLKHAIKKASLKKKITAIAALTLVFAIIAVLIGRFTTYASARDYEGHWASEYIEASKNRAWVKGYPDGTFRPDASITRAEFSVMLWRTLDLSRYDGSNPFQDIDTDCWYYHEVMDLYNAGIVEGYGNGVFGPEELLTREMAFKMIAKAFDLSADDNHSYEIFKDYKEVSSWAIPSISALTEKNYISGVGSRKLMPQRSLRRGEMAKLLITIFDGESVKNPGSEGESSTGDKPQQDGGIDKVPNKNEHPRILINEDKRAFLKTACKTEEPYKTWYARVKQDVDTGMNTALCQYNDNDELRLLSAGTFNKRLVYLSFVYLIEEDEIYADRAYEEIENAASWPDWNPKHYLDTADMLKGTGIAYDWMYDYFNKPENREKKTTLINAMVNLGLNNAKLAYDGEAGSNGWWVDADSNWNIVCNGGTAIAALAIADEPGQKELCRSVLEKGLDSKEKSILRFAPDGAWYEGIGYWSYTAKFLAYYTAAFETATGKDYVNLRRYGIENTAYFPIAMTGEKQVFNLNDASEGGVDTEMMFFFAEYFNDPAIAEYRYQQLLSQKVSPTIYDLIWFDADIIKGNSDYQTDFMFKDIEVATFRDTYLENDSIYAGIHGGENGVNHGQIDAGQFIYETHGERWAIDLGGDNYNLHAYFDDENKDKSRWSYYRNRGEGHNTVILNPDALADQPLEEKAEIKTFKADSEKGVGVVDMQPIYGEYTSRAQRGMLLNKQNSSLMVQDELSFKNNGNELYWFMHTRASVALSSDNKSAVLTSQSGERLWVGILDETHTFEVMKAEPLATSPNPNAWSENRGKPSDGTNTPIQNTNDGVSKLCIHDTNAGGEYTICVYMVPLSAHQTVPDTIPAVIDISQW